MQPKVGGKLHLKLNIGTRPIANKYREDAFSKWPEVKLVSSTIQRTIDVLQEIFATHGYPRLLVSDNGPQFTSEEFEYFLQSNNIAHHKSPPYHPAKLKLLPIFY